MSTMLARYTPPSSDLSIYQISKVYVKRQKCYGPDKTMAQNIIKNYLEVKGQGQRSPMLVRDTPPCGDLPTYQISKAYVKRQKSYGPDKASLRRIRRTSINCDCKQVTKSPKRPRICHYSLQYVKKPLNINFHVNRSTLKFWRPSWIQNGRHHQILILVIEYNSQHHKLPVYQFSSKLEHFEFFFFILDPIISL